MFHTLFHNWDKKKNKKIEICDFFLLNQNQYWSNNNNQSTRMVIQDLRSKFVLKSKHFLTHSSCLHHTRDSSQFIFSVNCWFSCLFFFRLLRSGNLYFFYGNKLFAITFVYYLKCWNSLMLKIVFFIFFFEILIRFICFFL